MVNTTDGYAEPIGSYCNHNARADPSQGMVREQDTEPKKAFAARSEVGSPMQLAVWDFLHHGGILIHLFGACQILMARHRVHNQRCYGLLLLGRLAPVSDM